MKNKTLSMDDIADWLKLEVSKIQYGTVSVEFVLHDNQVRRIEKSVLQSEKVD